MSIENAIARRYQTAGIVGKIGLTTSYPDEFEVYMCALELVDENNKTIEYFIFPTFPNSITETQNEITNIKKTAGGVTTLTTPQFIPRDITLQGTFGRSFKFLMGKTHQELASSFREDIKNLSFKNINTIDNVFDDKVKTGYGCLKILERIIKESKSVEGGLKRLIFYNLALGNSYFVKVMNFTPSQNPETNMMWSYSLQMKAIAPINAFTTGLKNYKQLRTDAYIQTQVDKLGRNISRIVKNKIPNIIKW